LQGWLRQGVAWVSQRLPVKAGRQVHWKVLLAEGEQRALLKHGLAGRQGLSDTVHSRPVQFGVQAQRLLLRKSLILCSVYVSRFRVNNRQDLSVIAGFQEK